MRLHSEAKDFCEDKIKEAWNCW